MEIDVSGIANNHNQRNLLLGMTLVLALVIFGLIGRPYTKADPEGYTQVLSWSDWRLFLVEQTYRAELKQLRAETDLLIESLNNAPDPVRAQLTAERIERQCRAGSPVLEHPRSLLVAAARNVQGWSVGVTSLDQARQSVAVLVKALNLPDSVVPAEEPTPVPLSFLPVVLMGGQYAPNTSYPAPEGKDCCDDLAE